MSTTSRRPPKYRHYRPKNLAVVRIDGHDLYLGTYNSPESREKYYRLLAEHAATGGVAPITARPHEEPADAGPTVAALLLAYYRFAETYYRRDDGTPTGELENLRLAFRPIEKLYGSTPARAFGPMALKTVRQDMVASQLARRTVNQRIARIVRAYKWGVENELIPADVHHALKAVPGLKRGRSGAKESKSVPSPMSTSRPHYRTCPGKSGRWPSCNG
jgi:hypothetical protein